MVGRTTVVTGLVFAALLCILAGAASAAMIDINDLGSSATTAGGAYFEQFGPQPTGSGVFLSFVRIGPDNGGLEAGYNTDGALEFQTKGGTHTHSIRLGDVPVVEGKLEFRLDICESEGPGESHLSLDVMKIYLADAPDITDYNNNIEPEGGPYNVVKIFDLGDDWVKMFNRNSGPGSGTGDMRCLIPIEDPGEHSPDRWLYLYSEFGGNSGYTASGGFEEWGVVPEPATIALLSIGVLSMVYRRKKV